MTNYEVQSEVYFGEQELQRFLNLTENTLPLTKEEYDFVVGFDSKEKDNFFYNSYDNKYLNLNIYSEVKHHDSVLRMEQN